MTQDLAALVAKLRKGRLALLGHEIGQAADALEAQAAEIARLTKQWEDHDAAWSERVAALTAALARLKDNLHHVITGRDQTFALMLARAEKAEAALSESQALLAAAFEAAARLCDETADEALEESGPRSRMIYVWFRGQAKAIRALPAASQPEAAPVAWNGQTGIKDKDGRMICVGDRIRINLTSKNTKEEYWLPEYVVEWVPPSFTLKYVGGGKDSDTARWRFRTPQSSMKKEIETVSTTPAPVVPADQRAAIEALADRMWRVHPKDIHAAGYEHLERGGKYENPRAAWHADQIEALFKQFRDQVSPVVPAEGLDMLADQLQAISGKRYDMGRRTLTIADADVISKAAAALRAHQPAAPVSGVAVQEDTPNDR